jgi:SAM-dependent methyltransferase
VKPPAVTAPDIQAWEAAYVRFESPAEEVRKFMRRLQQLGADSWPRDARVLDLFCGRGNGLVALERVGLTRLHGIDLSPRLVGRYRGGARCVVGDCRVLPFASGAYDIAIVQGGLHHLPALPGDLERVVAEVARVLVPRGLFVAVEPWLTPFLRFVHGVCESPLRQLSGRLDALATMIEHERETYEQWLGQPALVSSALASAFDVEREQRRWGKLLFVGRRRA